MPVLLSFEHLERVRQAVGQGPADLTLDDGADRLPVAPDHLHVAEVLPPPRIALDVEHHRPHPFEGGPEAPVGHEVVWLGHTEYFRYAQLEAPTPTLP